MSELNPYDKYLDGRPVQEILAATPGTLAGLMESIGADKSTKPPAPGKWSAAEIVCHLADCELVFAFRLRQTLAEDGHTIQPFDQEKWAAQYGGISAAQALGAFSAVRVWNLQLLRNTPPQAAPAKGHTPRARSHDLSDHRRNHGRARPESHWPIKADRRPERLSRTPQHPARPLTSVWPGRSSSLLPISWTSFEDWRHGACHGEPVPWRCLLPTFARDGRTARRRS